MLTRRVPLLAMLLVLAALAVPARAATDDGILLRGSRTAYVDLYVYVDATITPADITMHGKGSYVGFYMSPAPANRDTVGAMVMPRVGATGATSADVMKLGASWHVQPGKYRMFLVTDAPAEVFVPIPGNGFRGYAPRHAAPLSLRPVGFDVAAGSAGDTRQYPVNPRQRSLVVAAGLVASDSLTAVDTLDACVTADTSCATSVDPTTRLPAARAWTYGAALVPPGRYDGVIRLSRVGGVDAGSSVDAAIVVLTIGIQT